MPDFFAPYINRFASADTIVPNSANPQSWNRYSYVRNRPLNMSDPTGHAEWEDPYNSSGGTTSSPGQQSSQPPQTVIPVPTIPAGDIVTFNAGCGTCTAFTDEEIAAIQESATLTGTRLAETLNAANGWHLSPSDAFLLVYGGSVNFNKTGTICSAATGITNADCWGRSTGRNSIEVFTNAGDQLAGDVQWAVHELGHNFVNAVGTGPLRKLLQYQKFFPDFPNRPYTGTPNYSALSPWGFADGFGTWQRSDQGKASEEFADMYLGWVYNEWEARVGGGWTDAGQYRADFMNSLMPLWVDRW